MCEVLNTEPVDDQVPVEFDDLPNEVQQAFFVYRLLKDEIDHFNNRYLGKSYIGINTIFDIVEIEAEDRRIIYQLITIIDSIKTEEIKSKTAK